MAKLESEIVAAFRAGRTAAVGGRVSTSNPFDPGSELASVRLQAKMWLRGFSAGNPVPDPEDLESEEGNER